MIDIKKIFCPLHRRPFCTITKENIQSFFFLTITTLADLNMGNAAGTTNIQTMFDFLS